LQVVVVVVLEMEVQAVVELMAGAGVALAA
jgi:hypothetical protein